jgi:hypothetical protein
MKHFEITYHVFTHRFVCVCSSVYEASQILYDLATYDPNVFDVSRIDEFVQILVNMKNGKILSHSTHKITIKYLEGEV